MSSLWAVVFSYGELQVFFAENRVLTAGSLCTDDQRRTTSDGFCKIGHLYRRQRSFEAFVSHFQTGSVDGLFEIFAGKHTESVGHAGLLGGLPDAARDFVHDHVIVRGIAAQQATQANDGVVFLGLGESSRSGWNFKSAWHPDNFDVFFISAQTEKSVKCASQ